MKTRTKIPIVAALLALVAVGCQGPQTTPPAVVARDHTISVEELARQLGLRLDDRDDTFVVLRDAANTVLIFTHSDGRFFVNGKPIGSVGTVRRASGTVYVSESLVAQIKSHLGTAVAPARPLPRPARGVVVIDPGHGGRDPGAIAVTGIHEKIVNYDVAQKVAAILRRRGIEVVLTRQGDVFIELEARAEIANRRNADLFVSLHADSAPSPSAQGFTVYVAEGASADSQRAARNIARAMATTGLENRGVRPASYRVLVLNRRPAVLVEMGYLSNRQEALRLQDSAFQDRLAAAIATGILDYLQ
ncbi:N-acetylmuramoyl-L-alanine amidase family protein [Anaerobaca lacustris]|uniref:N-acetylmuramoyl-L-alanine amidase n=1 Tax=Anaerobaca lacustris TaxID=3044600 RepID=A0AAW6TSM5_9BACT|nr:N-acetylmuramoyl-L-alanine amidase [Sedimentisphaerales bacterium M17dextr]